MSDALRSRSWLNHQPSAREEGAIEALTNREHQHEHEPPTIYIADLAAYNHGELHGTWLAATTDLEELQRQIDEMLEASPIPRAEEWAIHDYAGFGAWRPPEYEDIGTVHRVAVAIAEHGHALSEWLSYIGDAEPETIEAFEYAHHGTWTSSVAYAEHVTDETNPIITVDPPSWTRYVRIDTDALARDLEIEMYVSPNPDGTITVFDPNAV